MNILGISAFYHDSAAALIRDGRIEAALQEERLTRVKHDFNFPAHAIAFCLKQGGLAARDLDYIVFYDKPLIKFERILYSYLASAPKGIASFLLSMPLWLKQKLWLPQLISQELDYDGPILFTRHHEAHAASAFFPSPFETAAFLTVDGVGEWTTTSYGMGQGNRLRFFKELRFPHSLGLLYSAFTYFTGFKVNSGEYKLMGLAPYGEPKYVDLMLEELVDLKADGSFKLNLKYFDYVAGLTMTNGHMDRLFGRPPRKPESPVTQQDMDIARSIQIVTEEIMMRMARTVHKETGAENLCLAGGVALNCVANGRMLREGPFQNIWIQPAAGDAGGAVGAALFAWYTYLDHQRTRAAHDPGLEPDDDMLGAYLGPFYPPEEIEAWLKERGAGYERLSEEALLERVAELLAQEKVIGWFQGRTEWGPRALGNRSIIGDARSRTMQKVMNLKIKYRESFRPFAPTVLREKVADYFELDRESPYMLLVAPVREERRRRMTEDEERLFGIDKLNVSRSDVPAITHVDYSARVQTVDQKTNPLYHRLISAFQQKTGCPVLINTSFNVRGEPIVCSPEHAYTCFMRTEMDFLVLGPFLLDKKEQPAWQEDKDWRKEFALD
ncbi:MAG: carbamoyltransferase [Thermodesulfobacteriota bacterium]